MAGKLHHGNSKAAYSPSCLIACSRGAKGWEKFTSVVTAEHNEPDD